MIQSVFFPVPLNGNHFGIHDASLLSLKEAFEALSIEVEMTRPDHPDFFYNLFRAGKNPEALIFFCIFFYDLRFSAQNHYRDTRLGDFLRCRSAATVADHPFSEFMRERLAHVHPQTTLLCLDPNYVQSIKLFRPDLTRFGKLDPCLVFAPDSDPMPYERRPIDLLIPITHYEKMTISQLLGMQTKGSDGYRLVTQTYDALLEDRRHNPIEIFDKVIQAAFNTTLSEQVKNKELFGQLMNILDTVDRCVRKARRYKMTHDLLRNVGDLNVTLIDRGLSPDLKKPGIHIVNEMPAKALGELMGQSKCVAHCHPTYPGGLHERIINAMGAGAVVLSDRFPEMEGRFEAGKEWLPYLPGQSISDLFASMPKEAGAEISRRSTKIARSEFSPVSVVKRILRQIDLSTGPVVQIPATAMA